jgi:hypothetical protein
MTTSAYRILVEIDWASSDLITRLWSGSGPVLDADLNVWKGVGIVDGLDMLEVALNGEASTLNFTLSGVSAAEATPLWLLYKDDQMIGSEVKFMIQAVGTDNKPVEEPEIAFWGTVDNVIFRHVVTTEDTQEATVVLEIVNRFAMRRLSHGGVYSSADQIEYAKTLNPTGNPDRICERTSTIEDVMITYPRWN